jgi:hypothetical protein
VSDQLGAVEVSRGLAAAEQESRGVRQGPAV